MKKHGFTLVELPVVRKRAFTLVELLVVIAIIGILATVVMMNVTGAQSKSRYAKVISDMVSISKAVDLYQTQNNNVYPNDVNPNVVPSGLSDYLATWPTPPCGANYQYDYENWTTSRGPNGGLIGVDFVYIPTSGFVYYYDIHNFSSVSANKGADIKTVNTITCSEPGQI